MFGFHIMPFVEQLSTLSMLVTLKVLHKHKTELGKIILKKNFIAGCVIMGVKTYHHLLVEHIFTSVGR